MKTLTQTINEAFINENLDFFKYTNPIMNFLVRIFGNDFIITSVLDKPQYDYSNGKTIHRLVADFRDINFTRFNDKTKNILKNNKFREGGIIKFMFYFEQSMDDNSISNSEFYIQINDTKYNESVKMNGLQDISFVNNFIKDVKSKKFNGQDLEALMSNGNYSSKSFNSKELENINVGIGSSASIKSVNSYESTYSIKDLDKLLPKKEIEKIMQNFYIFKRSNLVFDWDKGILIVDGKYSETYD